MLDMGSRIEQREKALIVASILCVAMLGFYFDYQFLPDITSGGANSGDLVANRYAQGDGLGHQINMMRLLIERGEIAPFFEEPLFIVHMFRFLLIAPFELIERFFGAPGQLIVLGLLCAPLIINFRPVGKYSVLLFAARLPILVFPLLVSGRTTLVAIGMGYLMIGLLRRRRVSLVLGGALSVLSSASIILSMMMCVLYGNSYRSRGFWIYRAVLFFMLSLALLPSVIEKTGGFYGGSAGYQSASEISEMLQEYANEQKNKAREFSSDIPTPKYTIDFSVEFEKIGIPKKYSNFLDRIISRSTIYISYSYDQRLRLCIYISIALANIFAVLFDLFRRRFSPFFCSLVFLSGGLLVEGLGAWTLLWPLVWRYTWWRAYSCPLPGRPYSRP